MATDMLVSGSTQLHAHVVFPSSSVRSLNLSLFANTSTSRCIAPTALSELEEPLYKQSHRANRITPNDSQGKMVHQNAFMTCESCMLKSSRHGGVKL